jgi:hypothetical protein
MGKMHCKRNMLWLVFHVTHIGIVPPIPELACGKPDLLLSPCDQMA